MAAAGELADGDRIDGLSVNANSSDTHVSKGARRGAPPFGMALTENSAETRATRDFYVLDNAFALIEGHPAVAECDNGDS